MPIPQKHSHHSTLSPHPISITCCWWSWLVLASSPAPHQSPIQCLQTLDQYELKPLHTTESEIASLPDMSGQRMFTSFLQQTALLVTSNRDNEQTRLTTCQHDNPQDHCLFDIAKRERISNASTHTIRLRLSDATNRIETHKQISRGAIAASSTRL